MLSFEDLIRASQLKFVDATGFEIFGMSGYPRILVNMFEHFKGIQLQGFKAKLKQFD
jgi:hypothetical protein